MSALPSYRGLLRATRIAFMGDQRVLLAARQRIRQEFIANAKLPVSEPEYQQAIQKAQDVALLLRSNVVQGQNQGDNVYKLRIHEETERGDNESIKQAQNSSNKDQKVCCRG